MALKYSSFYSSREIIPYYIGTPQKGLVPLKDGYIEQSSVFFIYLKAWKTQKTAMC